MNYFRILLLTLILSNIHSTAQEIPVSDLLYPVIDTEFNLSPSGDHMASVREFPNGFSIFITSIKRAAVEKQIPLGDGRISNLNWISENRISFEQYGILFAINIDGTEHQQLMSIFKDDRKSYFSTYSLLNNIQSSKMVNVLEDDFEHILIETRGLESLPVIYKLNIFTGEKEEIENGNTHDIDQWLVDRKGNVRLGIELDDDEIKFFSKTGEDKWESNNELKLNTDGGSFINRKLNFLDFDYDENIIYVASSVNNPTWRILAYDFQKKAFVDTVLQDSIYDIGNPIHDDTELLFMDSEAKLAGIRYERDKPCTKWFSDVLQTRQDSLEKRFTEYYIEIFDWNNDASIVLAKIFSDVDPGHIVFYDAEINKPIMFCTYNKKLLKYPVCATKLIKYKARDGYEIDGYMNLPLKQDGKTPFVIMPHGGPWARDYWRYDPVVQFFTSQGYGILRMNYRGSTGYGIDHLLSGVKKISSLMIDDIADGASWVIKNNYADSSNIFLYGHSYGGYAALESIIRYPHIYNAAVAIAAPTDIIELMDYYDDKDNEFNYEFWKTTVGDPDDEDEYLERISPYYNIDKIKRPVFLFHGQDDFIVPVEQTEEFIEEAEDLGRKFEYKIIKDEDHGISENRNKEYILKKAIQFYKENSSESEK